MKIVVLIKRVPDTAASIRIAPDGKTIAQDVEWILSPYDEMAVEEALRIKEKVGTAEVVAITVAPKDANSHLKLALEMGADRALHLTDDAPVMDAWGIASALTEAIRAEKPDLILAGRTAVDLDQSFVCSAVAALLDMPLLGSATKLEISGNRVTVRHEIEGGHETIAANLPCVVTAQKGLNEPRYPSLKSKMAAKKKPLDVRPVVKTAPRSELVSLVYPPTRKAGKVLGNGVEAVPELIRVLRDDLKLF